MYVLLNLVGTGLNLSCFIFFQDGIKWHDIACYHTKPFVCEDSDQLLEFVRATHPEMNVPEPSDALSLESIL